jgi:hypothetical protein
VKTRERALLYIHRGAFIWLESPQIIHLRPITHLASRIIFLHAHPNYVAMARTEVTTADPYAYLKWPRLIVFNLNGALSIVATGLAAQCKSPSLPARSCVNPTCSFGQCQPRQGRTRECFLPPWNRSSTPNGNIARSVMNNRPIRFLAQSFMWGTSLPSPR